MNLNLSKKSLSKLIQVQISSPISIRTISITSKNNSNIKNRTNLNPQNHKPTFNQNHPLNHLNQPTVNQNHPLNRKPSFTNKKFMISTKTPILSLKEILAKNKHCDKLKSMIQCCQITKAQIRKICFPFPRPQIKDQTDKRKLNQKRNK